MGSLIFQRLYNVGMIPDCGLGHCVLQSVEEPLGGFLAVGHYVAFGVSAALVAAAKVDDAKGVVGVVCGDVAAACLAFGQRRLEVVRSGGYHLQHWPRPLPGREEYRPGLAGQLKRINGF